MTTDEKVQELERQVDVLTKLIKIVYCKGVAQDPYSGQKFIDHWLRALQEGNDWTTVYYSSPR